MSRPFTLRRMPKRFRDADCPEGVLDIFDEGPDGSADRYTVIYTRVMGDTFSRYVGYRGMSSHPTHPQGIGIYGEFKVHECMNYRRACAKKRVKWSDLPKDVRAVVLHDCKDDA